MTNEGQLTPLEEEKFSPQTVTEGGFSSSPGESDSGFDDYTWCIINQDFLKMTTECADKSQDYLCNGMVSRNN